MSNYEIVYILTNFIYIFSTNKLFELFFNKKCCNTKFRNISLVAYYLVLTAIIFITRIPIILMAINIFFLLLISLSYKSSFQKKILSISLIYSMCFIIEIISLGTFGFFGFSGLDNATYNSISVLIFTRVFTLALTYLLCRYRGTIKKEYTIPKIYYLAFFVVLFGTLYLFIAQLDNPYITITHIFINGFVLISINLTMIVIDEKIYTAIISENEKKILKQQIIAYENQAEIIRQSTEAIKLLKHDFKNHLIMLSQLHEDNKIEKIEPYINNLLGCMDNELLSNSNNFVIDSIINFKLKGIKNKDIKISINTSVPISINILAHDLTAVLGNLLDNAITACEKSKEQVLNIKICSKMDNLMILINNSYDGNLIVEDGKFKTTKIFKSSHGLGLKSIERTLELYGGEMRTDYTSNTFSTSVIIPY